MTVGQDVIDLFDRFTHGAMSRRVFMDRLVLLTGSAAAASALLPLLENNYARAAMVAEDDARLATEMTRYQGPDSEIRGYLARPVDKVMQPAVIVIHENRGLNPHIQDVARRIALEGFLAFAPDMLSPAGGTPDDPDQARDMIGKLEP
ncbi:MAG: dienelactone hydrolase family protein, partial [Dongiaceae bacterium]